jgi:hypothetical protein
MTAPANPSVGTEWTDEIGVARVCRSVTPRVWVIKRAPKHSSGADPHSNAVDGDTWTSDAGRLHHYANSAWRDLSSARVPQTFSGAALPVDPAVGDRWNDSGLLCEFTTDGTTTYWREV